MLGDRTDMATASLTLGIVAGYWTTTWYDSRGKRHWHRFGNINKVSRNEAVQAFNAFHKQWLDDPATRDPKLGVNAKLKQLADAYQVWAETYYRKASGRPTGEATNVKDAMKVVIDLFGTKRANVFTVTDLKECRDAMVEAGLSRPTVNARINRIRRVFRWGAENGAVAPATWWGLKAVSSLKKGRSAARETTPVKPIPEQHIKAVREILPLPLRAMIDLQLVTGMRPGEVRIIRPIDIDTSGTVWVYMPSEHKSEHHGRARKVGLGPKAQKIVKPFLNRRVDAFLFDPREALREGYDKCETHRSKPNTERKTTRKLGDHYTKDSYCRAIRDACGAADVPHWTPNRLRHNCATRLRKQYGVEAARVVLGHAKLNATELYAEIDEKKSLKIMQEVG